MNKAIYGSTIIAAVLLTALCLALPTYQWATLSDVFLVQILGGFSALALGICKITFYPIAIDNWRARRWLQSLVFFGTATIALFFSVTATTSVIEDGALTKQHGQAVNSYAHQQAVNNVATLNNAIASLNESIQRDIAGNFRQRAYDQQDKLAQLISERAEALRAVETSSKTSPIGTQSTLLKNVTIGTQKYSFLLSGATGAALAIHLGCVLSILALSQRREEINAPHIETTKAETRAEKTKRRKKEEQLDMFGEKIKTPKLSELADDQTKLFNDIKSGAHGQNPVLRDMINNRVIKGGYHRVAPVFKLLLAEKTIAKVGKNYQLQGE